MHTAVQVGPGDDCAIIDGPRIALTADLSIEGIHFRREWCTAHDIGWRAVVASLSDLAAMAATPIGVLITVAATREDAAGFAREVMAGASEAAARFDADLLGGDVSRSPGPLVLDVIAAGHVEQPVLRSGARIGDGIWVTGTIGGAAAAVAAFETGQTPTAEARAAFARPTPRLAEARWLAERGVLHALIDLSDGVAGDAAHIAAASGVRIAIQTDRLPFHAALHVEQDRKHALNLALGGGEDYELCFAAPPAMDALVAPFEDAFGLPVTRIGRVIEGDGVFQEDEDGTLRPIERTGFSHL